MKFEEALNLMRQGKKITHSSLGENVHFQACRLRLMFDDNPLEESPISIVKMLGETEHPDMRPQLQPLIEPCKHGNFPQLNLLLVMSDEWEIME